MCDSCGRQVHLETDRWLPEYIMEEIHETDLTAQLTWPPDLFPIEYARITMPMPKASAIWKTVLEGVMAVPT